jgi:hypothetical protein
MPLEFYFLIPAKIILLSVTPIGAGIIFLLSPWNECFMIWKPALMNLGLFYKWTLFSTTIELISGFSVYL